MSNKTIQAVRGMRGVIPGVAAQHSEIEGKALRVIRSYAYEEMYLPVLEYTELFARGVGESTDIVEKEMYSLEDRDGVSLSMRPEGTAGCLRTLQENGLLYNQTQKVFYLQNPTIYLALQGGSPQAQTLSGDLGAGGGVGLQVCSTWPQGDASLGLVRDNSRTSEITVRRLWP